MRKASYFSLFIAGLLLMSSAPAWSQGSVYYFPHGADGSIGASFYYTQFFFNNPFNHSISVTMTFRQPNGSAWNIDLRSSDTSFGNTSGVVTFVLGAKKTAHFFTGGLGTLKVGWCKVEASDPLEVSEVFANVKTPSSKAASEREEPTNKIGGYAVPYSYQLISEVGVLPGPLSTQFSFDADVTADWPLSGTTTNTGLAVANPGSSTANITADLFTVGGTLVSEKSITLNGLSQSAFFVNSLFTDALPPTKTAGQDTITGTFHGMIRLSSNVNISALVLRDNFVGGSELFSSLATNSDATLGYNIFYDVEPNDTIATAQSIMVPARIVGTMNSPSDGADADCFSLYLNAGQTLSVFAVADILGSPLNDTIQIFNPSSTPVAYNDDLASGLRDPFVSYVAPVGGYYVILHGSIGGTSSRSSHYELLVRTR